MDDDQKQKIRLLKMENLKDLGRGLILEASFRPNRVSNPTQIASFESSPNSFVHREGSDSCFGEKLVGRHSPTSVLVVVMRFVVIAISPTALSVFVAENL
ncbi:hypothetical protein CR513_52148, partial [Mucuna pruriens]